MVLLEALTVYLGPALAKAVLKMWLPEKSLSIAAGESIIEMLKKRGESFATADATDRLFRNLASEVAERLKKTIEIEFPRLPESDGCAAVLAVAEVFKGLDLSRDLMRADLNAVSLEQMAKPQARALFADLGGQAQSLAELTLRECCAYAVTLAGKLPDFNVVATREILKRTSELTAEMTRVLDVVGSMREQAGRDGAASGFETQYRRLLSQRLDRMQLFGVRLVGAGAREPEISVAYVTLTSTRGGQSRDVDTSLASLTRVVVRGEAGSGKTTLLQWLAIRAARRDFAGALAPWNARVPIYVSLRDYAEGAFPPPEALIAGIAPNLAALMPPAWAHEQLTRGALVLIDGVDEVPVARRNDLFEWLRALVEDFPQSQFVLSSRPAALDAKGPGGTAAQRLAGLGYEQITLEPMSLADSEALISQWHQAVGRDLSDEETLAKLDRYERDLIRTLRDRPAIRSLASNPLLCSMICVLNWDRQERLPDNRMELYGFALEMLIDARDADRKIKAAHLAELDRPSKEALLDGIAYWMMRNGATEADRGDVEAQVGVLLQRLSKVPQMAVQVLQELLERSGVLRQPQFGVVDFVHRTFLEYMAARAAVSAGDLGLLAEKAREDAWRETIVFAAGHAQGKQRDQLIARLLKKPFFSLYARPVEAEVTAVCCLETAGANLAPGLLQALRAYARNLFPPSSVEAARLLAPAAYLDPNLLLGHENAGEGAVAACIRCASIIGSEPMLKVIETYADYPGERVWKALLDAWTAFDEREYQDRVILKRSGQKLGGLPLSALDADALGCLQLLVLKGTYDKSSEALSGAMDDFINGHILRLGGQTYGREDDTPARVTPARSAFWSGSKPGTADAVSRPTKRVTESDAKRLTAMKSIRHLSLGTSDRGVLEAVISLPALETLVCSPVDPTEIAVFARCQTLVELQLDALSVPSRARDSIEIDLQPLVQCRLLKRLTVKHIGGKSLKLPTNAQLSEISLVYVPVSAVTQLQKITTLEELKLQLKELPEGELDMTRLTRLTHLDIYTDNPIRVTLPHSLRDLTFSNTPVAEVINAAEIVNLEELSLWRVKKLLPPYALFNQPKLRKIWVDEVSRSIVEAGLKERSEASEIEVRVL